MKFYKYASWTGKSGGRTRENILENAVYLASPEVFNDPFDFNPVYDPTATYQEQVRHITGIYKRIRGMSKTKARREAIKNLRENPNLRNRESLERFARESKEGLRKKLGVSCFTRKPGNSPMWAHYAEQHQGILLGMGYSRNR